MSLTPTVYYANLALVSLPLLIVSLLAATIMPRRNFVIRQKMDLKSFVKAALNDVMDAVQETIEERKADGKHGYINPKVHDPDEMEIDTIKFDVAVSAGTKTQGGVEGALEVFSVKFGGNGSREHETSNVSRIEFTLGVAWPHTHMLDARKITRAN